MSTPPPDRCPGALRLHPAADGGLARIRLPGGAITAEQIGTLARLATGMGNGILELTGRGNIQVRGLGDDTAGVVATLLRDAGLLPSDDHDRARNIISSPLSGLVGGFTDSRPLVVAWDDLLRSDAGLAELPGRFLVAFDDGRGDVAALDADITVMAYDETTSALLLRGEDTGARIAHEDAVAAVHALARAFLRLANGAWRIRDLPAHARAHLLSEAGLELESSPQPVHPSERPQPPIGWFAQEDGGVALGAAVPLGRLHARLAEFLEAIERPLLITPWRGIVITGLDEWRAEQVVRVLAPLGLVFDAESPWARLSACTGQPGCASSRTDVHADVQRAVADGDLAASGGEPALPEHWAGCDRACGAPRGATIRIAQPGGGYRTR
ncbi:precorrin-3B synthase [Hoyosella sp. G463]|uniref:Precorrin-3B synthase n=1 Tax=Lolliginicoccus lacisalsi TaxID=2742202 RepID=A0A927PL84_9ACTN|nr:precorrin-3B synthase [Lolliginicoccus lacisalsi]